KVDFGVDPFFLGRQKDMFRWLNVIGPGLGMIGVIIIFLWGPPQPSFQQGVCIGLEDATLLQDQGGKTVAEINAETKGRKQTYQFMSKAGLVLIFIGFGCQLVASWPR